MSLSEQDREQHRQAEPACECGHHVTWHGHLGCGFFGWLFGEPKCGCHLTSQAAVDAIVRRHVTAALDEAADHFDDEDIAVEVALQGSHFVIESLRERANRNRPT